MSLLSMLVLLDLDVLSTHVKHNPAEAHSSKANLHVTMLGRSWAHTVNISAILSSTSSVIHSACLHTAGVARHVGGIRLHQLPVQRWAEP